VRVVGAQVDFSQSEIVFESAHTAGAEVVSHVWHAYIPVQVGRWILHQ